MRSKNREILFNLCLGKFVPVERILTALDDTEIDSPRKWLGMTLSAMQKTYQCFEYEREKSRKITHVKALFVPEETRPMKKPEKGEFHHLPPIEAAKALKQRGIQHQPASFPIIGVAA